MGATNSQFYQNVVRVFAPKAPNLTIYSDDMNQATDEIEGIATVLGTGLRSRTSVSWEPTTNTWQTLSQRLNNMDAGIRSNDPSIHPQYARSSGTVLQPSDTATQALTVRNAPGSSLDIASIISSDGATTARFTNTSVLVSVDTFINSTLTVSPGNNPAAVFNVGTSFTGNALAVVKGPSTNFSVSADGVVTANGFELAPGKSPTFSNFTFMQHDHSSPAQGGNVFPAGSVIMWGGSSNTVPTGWLWCNGAAVSRTTYAALFAAVGTNFGSGNGTTTFNLPDYRAKYPRGAGNSLSSTGTPGTTGGQTDITIDNANLPIHSHSFNHNHAGVFTSGGDNNHTHTMPVVNMNLLNGSNTINALAGGTTSATIGNKASSGQSAGHVHVANVDPYTGNTGGAGASVPDPINVEPEYVSINYIIKV